MPALHTGPSRWRSKVGYANANCQEQYSRLGGGLGHMHSHACEASPEKDRGLN